MSLKDYIDGVDIFFETLGKWERASADVQRFERLMPSKPNIELPKFEIRSIIDRVRASNRFEKNASKGRYVMSDKEKQRFQQETDPHIQRAIKEAIATARRKHQKRCMRALNEYNEAREELRQLIQMRERLRKELMEWIELIVAENDHLLPRLPEFDDYKEEISHAGIAARGTLLSRVVIDPRYLTREGHTTIMYAQSYTAPAFDDHGFVEFALPGNLECAEEFAKVGHPADTQDREDAIVLAVDLNRITHSMGGGKITIKTSQLANKPARIFRIH